jgi:hypothetical protein
VPVGHAIAALQESGYRALPIGEGWRAAADDALVAGWFERRSTGNAAHPICDPDQLGI